MVAIARPQPIAFILLSAAAVVLWAGQRSAPSTAIVTALRERIPLTLGAWKGTPLDVTDRVVEVLETNDVALIEYKLGEDQPIWFAQVAGFGNRAAFHPPELCYVGSHFEVLERGPVTVTANGREMRIMRLVLSQDKEMFEAWYWFTANGRVTPNYYQQQWWLALDSIRRKPMSGTLVRISTPYTKDPDVSHRRLLDFLSAFDAAHEVSPNG